LKQRGRPLTYLHPDHLGSTAMSTDHTGAFQTGQGYMGYGKYRSGGSLPTNYRYTGQELDIPTGLMYYGARYYDRTVGMFISPDTLVPDPTTLWDYNRFAYGRLNPLKYNDPTGHWVETALDIVSLGMTVHDIRENGLNWENGIGLVADVGSLVLPGVAGGGAAVRHADDAYALGKQGVSWAGDKFGEGWSAAKRWWNGSDEAADAARTLDNAPCANSFSGETLVMTPAGSKPIAELVEGDIVLAYNEATGEVGPYTVTATISHIDAIIVVLTIDGETLKTTADHPFYELESAPWLVAGETRGRWTEAGDLALGNTLWQADGTIGVVQSVELVEQPHWMYNLTVAEAHTFFVGDGQWLVHNAGPCNAIVDGKAVTASALGTRLANQADAIYSSISRADREYT
jgi:RHS repeat-associated protein